MGAFPKRRFTGLKGLRNTMGIFTHIYMLVKYVNLIKEHQKTCMLSIAKQYNRVIDFVYSKNYILGGQCSKYIMMHLSVLIHTSTVRESPYLL